MCNANQLQTTILNIINTFSKEDLENFLKLHGFELSCFLKFGLQAEKLNSLDIELVKKHVSLENLTKESLHEAGMTQAKLDEIFGPVGVSCPKCQKNFVNQEDFIAYKQYCTMCNDVPPPPPPPPPSSKYDLIRNNDASASAKDIRNWIARGEITKEGLMSECQLSPQLVDQLAGFYNVQMDDQDVSNLPPLKTDRTDFYFLGMPNAGKSCLIASLLSFWEYVGIYNSDISNPRSLKYADVLLDPFNQGYLPDRTETGFIDYINGELQVRVRGGGLLGRGETTRYIPINILDMAGEAWREAADANSGLPQHRSYLDNRNEKAIIIVIDCSNPESTRKQCRKIGHLLNYFTEWGIWEKTASVAVVISKADLLTTSTDYDSIKKAAENFYNGTSCLNLKNRIDEVSSTNRFKLSVLPYSIGACRFGQILLNPSFESNQLMADSTRNLSNWILQNTGGYNGGGFGGLFSN
jgi:hypothetical protein